jgi:two-component system cell cycle response regulator DivK
MSKTILVVDDDRDSRDALRTYLETSGFDVCIAEDGYEAVQKALDEHPDLVIMDMAMPLVDGINSTRTMRLHDELRKTPIIALTGFGSFYRPRAFDAGCTEVLSKPIDFLSLGPIVKKHLGH